MLAAAAAMYGAAASPAFGFRDVRIDGVRYTDRAEVTRRLALADDANLFALSTDAVERRLRDLASVAAVDVGVELPGTVAVRVVEREPILAWTIGKRRLLVDRDGLLFATATPDSARGLPAVDDHRSASAAFDVGARLEAVDLDAATRLASIRPADIGSAAPALSLAVSDESGFVLHGPDGGWSAIFGFYTTSLRTPALIPGQVRLLHGLLAGREAQVERVILASDTSGTYVPRTTPKPSATARP
jgi:POTRA domain, FtsQ-type